MALPARPISLAYCSSRLLDPTYSQTIVRTATRCGSLDADTINAYLRARLGKVSRTTVKNERSMLLILWRWAYETHLTDHAPRGVAAVRAARLPIAAWSLDEVRRLVKQAGNHRGKLTRNGADMGAWLECWLVLGYETGARWGDLWAMRDTHVHGHQLRFSMRKTGEPAYRQLSPHCVALVTEMLRKSPDGRILGWVCGKRRAMRVMKSLLAECGLSGTSKWLRRSAATHIEQRQRGQAKAFLGHRSPGMAERHYIDWSQIPSELPTPPQLNPSGY